MHYCELYIIAFFNFCKLLRPRFVIAENVPGIKSDKTIHYLHTLLKSFESIDGYETAIWEMDALSFGGCQTRQRLVVVASRTGNLPLKPEGTSKPKTLREVIGNMTEDEAMADGCAKISETFEALLRGKKEGDRIHPCAKSIRPFWDRPSRCLMTGPMIKKMMLHVHPERNRLLSVREYAHIMGVPGFKFPPQMPIKKSYEIIGQAVPPQFGRAIVERLVG